MANGVVKMQSFVAIPAIVGGGGRRWAPPSRVTNVYVLRNWVALLWIICSTLVSRSASYSPNGHHLTTSSTSTVVPDESGPLSEVQTAVGLDASMPCELIPTSNMGGGAPDKVQLVIWYKEGNAKPIYTFDARNRELQRGVHWVDSLVLSNMTRFHFDTNPPSLRIPSVTRNEAGLYRCRVDFHKSPTRNSRISLTVLVPPTHITILDDMGAAVTDNTVGPYQDGSTINLTCMSSGGVPPPRVTWWKDHLLLDDTFEILPDGSVKNVLQLTRINRQHLHSIYTCQATNGHVVPPKSTYVKLEMRLPPLHVNMHGLNSPLVAGVRTHIICRSAGARPAPNIIWSKGGVGLRGATQTISADGNVTTSELVFQPAPEDNGKIITCSITTETLNGATGLFLKDSRILDVRHAPIVSLSLGQPLDPNKLMNGSDVYLECDVKANPPIKKVEWFHSDKQLYASRRIIISNQTLVLQSITKASHGQYMCRATNLQGSVSSNDVYVDVKYGPMCRAEATVIRAALKQVVNITCDIDANPMSNLTFKWQFNNTLETVVELPALMLSNVASVGDLGGPDSHPFGQSVHGVKAQYQQQHSFGHNSIEKQSSKAGNGAHRYHHHQQQQGTGHHRSQLRNQQREENLNSGQLYPYKIDTFSNFGTVTCYAENSYGNSGPCYYHILAAELPDPVKNCTAFNITSSSLQVQCLAGKNGGIPQQFHVEVVEYLTKELLVNVSFKMPEFLLKRLPSDTEILIKVLSYNLQGSSSWYRLKARTLTAPLLKTASSTAVLVQLTPLLGVLLGIVGTVILVTVFVAVCLKINKKKIIQKNCDGTTATQPDKGSVEPLNRNMLGSHSSLDDKNPDVIPQEPTSDDEFLSEEKAFERLNSEKILYDQTLNLSTASTIMEPPSPTHATLKSMLNSATLQRTNSGQNKSKFGELSLTTNPSFALYNSPMHSVSPTNYSPGSNIYTRIPTRPSTAMGTAYFPSDHQLKFVSDTSPTCASGSLIIPTTSSAPAYVYKNYGNGNGVLNSVDGGGIGSMKTGTLNNSGLVGLRGSGCGVVSDNINNSPASNYVLYGTTTKKQLSPSLLGGPVVGVANVTTVTTPLISTANYNGYGKSRLVTTTTGTAAATGNYDEFIS